MRKLVWLFVMWVAAVAIAPPVSGQGLQTGVMSGVVKDPDGLAVPGASVTATSPALQGERTTVTDAFGAYVIRGLPPGTYTVRFEIGGFTSTQESVVVPLGGVAQLSPVLRLGVAESVTVTASATPPPLAVTQRSTNLRVETIESLPIGRRPFEIAELAPGVTDNTPNVGQMAIGGGFGFDSIFLIDGVDTNDNLFGSSHNLFVEGAILETQVLTSGISAEYGRFGGGVVNVITKSGGNTFSGGFRANFSRPSWTDETPFEKSRNQQRGEVLSKFYEVTVGGPVVRDRLWFFNADRYENSQQGEVLSEVGTPYSIGNNNKRFEVKLTGTPVSGHRVSGTFLNNPTVQADRPPINATFAMDPNTLVDRELPNNLWVVNWNGALTNKAFATFQWSRKESGFRNAGGSSAVILDSPYLSRGVVPGAVANRQYNAPYFSNNDPEDRNNRQFTGSLAYYVSNPSVGRHDLKGGFEHFRSVRTGGNSQSATGFVVRTDYLVGADGRPIIDSTGRPIPVWGGNAANPAAAATRVENWLATAGATLGINTLSLYLQDRWTVHDRLTADIGLRFEKVRSEATGGIVGADTDSLVPRLGLSFDVEGNARTIAQVTYARYSGRYTERYFGRNTAVGSPSLVNYAYVGPSGQGRDFAPGLNLANYVVIGGNFPTANVFFEPGLTSPKTNEFTLSLGRDFSRGGYSKVIYTWRKASDFIEDFIDDPSAAGKTTVVRNGVNFGTFDNVTWRNTGRPTREYQDVQFQSRVRFTDRLWVEGNWTVQLENNGNFEGEVANQPGNGTIQFDYPELFSSADRYYPYGRLDEFQRHKFRLYSVYSQDLGRFGSVDISPIWRVNSGLTYSLFANGVALSAIQRAQDPGYARGSTATASLFFDELGSESFKGYGLLDLSLRYGIPVWRTAKPWIQMSVFNLLDNDKLIQWNTAVTPDPNSPLDALGQPTGYVKAATFGQGTQAGHYPRWSSGETGGRTFRVFFGITF